MNKISYSGYRFPPEIIQQAIWLYLRFTLSLRDVEDLLAEREVAVSYETVRRWVNHFGPMIAADLRKRRLKPSRCGPHTRAVTLTCYTEGFSHFVTSMTAPVASGWSVSPGGIHPLESAAFHGAHPLLP